MFSSTAALVIGVLAGSAAGAADLPPYCAHIAPTPDNIPGAVSLTYKTVGARGLRIHLFLPQTTGSALAAALFFFGGGFRTGDPRTFLEHAKAFAARGYVAAIADYRVLCRDGVKPSEEVDDAEAAFRWLRRNARRFDFDPRRIVVVGGSAGGFLAASVAAAADRGRKPEAVVLLNPVTNLRTGPWSEGMTPDQIGSMTMKDRKLERFPPTIVLHGTADTTVPFVTAQTFCANVRAAGGVCELDAYPGLNHSFYMLPTPSADYPDSPKRDAMAKIFRFLEGDDVMSRRAR